MGSSVRTHHVLVIDDDPTMRALLMRAAKQMRMEVSIADSFAEARRLLEAGLGPDLLLTDYLLGDGTGADVVRLARRLKLTAPSVLVTATPHTIEAEDRVLFSDVVSKPFRLSLLFDALEVARRSVRPRQYSATQQRPSLDVHPPARTGTETSGD